MGRLTSSPPSARPRGDKHSYSCIYMQHKPRLLIIRMAYPRALAIKAAGRRSRQRGAAAARGLARAETAARRAGEGGNGSAKGRRGGRLRCRACRAWGALGRAWGQGLGMGPWRFLRALPLSPAASAGRATAACRRGPTRRCRRAERQSSPQAPRPHAGPLPPCPARGAPCPASPAPVEPPPLLALCATVAALACPLRNRCCP